MQLTGKYFCVIIEFSCQYVLIVVNEPAQAGWLAYVGESLDQYHKICASYYKSTLCKWSNEQDI